MDSWTSANAMLIPISVAGTSSARTLAARGKWRLATSPANRNSAIASRPAVHAFITPTVCPTNGCTYKPCDSTAETKSVTDALRYASPINNGSRRASSP